jgi:hypothetical protein
MFQAYGIFLSSGLVYYIISALVYYCFLLVWDESVLSQVRKLEAYIISYWYKKGHRPIEHPLLPDARRIVKFDLYDDSVSTRI